MRRNPKWQPNWVPSEVPGRAFIVSKMTRPQIESLHALEIRTGRPLVCAEIRQRFHTESTVIDDEYRSTLNSFACSKFPDATDPEPPQEAPGCADEPWYNKYPHVAIDLGCFHSFDWKVHHEGLPKPTTGTNKERVSDRIDRRAAERRDNDDPTGDRRVEGSTL